MPQVIDGKYQVLSTLGSGGMGTVLRARDLSASRTVAVKLPHSADLTEVQLKRFLREGQVMASLDHPGILRVYSCGETGGRPYLVCELVEEARTLDELSALPLQRKLAILRDVARALGHAHAHGVVHRDLKPENVLVDSEGRARVTDFGLALAEDQDRLTKTGTRMGTPGYMAPELFADAKRSGPPTDTWALGVMLYEVLSGGRTPFVAPSIMELAAAVARGKPAPLKDAPVALARIVRRALNPEMDERYPDGEALALDLERYLRGELEPTRRRRIGLAAVVVVTLAALAVGGLTLLEGLTGSSAEAPRPGSAPPSKAGAGSEVDAGVNAVAKIEERLAFCDYTKARALCEAELARAKRPEVERLFALSVALDPAAGATQAGEASQGARRLAERCQRLEQKGYRELASFETYDFPALSEEAERLMRLTERTAERWGDLRPWVVTRGQRTVATVALTRVTMFQNTPRGTGHMRHLVDRGLALDGTTRAAEALRFCLVWHAYEDAAGNLNRARIRDLYQVEPRAWAALLPEGNRFQAHGLWFLLEPSVARRAYAEASLKLPIAQDLDCMELARRIHTQLGLLARLEGSKRLAAGDVAGAQGDLDRALKHGQEGVKHVTFGEIEEPSKFDVAQLVATYLVRDEPTKAWKAIRAHRPNHEEVYFRTLLEAEVDLVTGETSAALQRLESTRVMRVQGRYVEEFTARAHARALVGDSEGARQELQAAQRASRRLWIEWRSLERIEAVMAGGWWPGRGAR